MATVTFTPGAPTVNANWIQWQNRDAPVGLADASSLSPDTLPRYIQRIRLWRDGRSAALYLNAKSATPDGSNAFDSGDDLNDEWEASAAALTLTATNGTIVFPGPAHADTATSDDAEPYSWSPHDASALTAWIIGYTGLTPSARANVTITLDDGGTPTPTDRDVAATFTGAAGSLSAVVTRQLPATRPVAATFPGTGGSLAAAITKSEAANGLSVANYNAIVALPGAYAIRFNASNAHQDYYEFNPAEGTLLNNFPAGMFSDTSIYWIERVRGTFDGITAVNDGGQSYVKVTIGFHRDNSTQDQDAFLSAMPDDASWILINETTEEWLMWPANGSQGGQLGSGFVNYQVIPSYISDTSGLNVRDVQAVAEDFDGIVALIAGQVFQNGLINSELVVGLIPNNTFRPTFGVVATDRDIAANFPGAAGSLSAAVTKESPTTHAVAATFGGTAGSISAALQRQIATINRPIAATFPGAGGTLSAAVTKRASLLPIAASFAGTAGSLAAAVLRIATALSLPVPNDISVDYRQDFSVVLPEAMDGAPPYTYSISGIPVGDSFAFDPDTRTLSGGSFNVGTHALTYTVTDDNGNSKSQDFDLIVAAIVPGIPTVQFAFSATLLTVNWALPDTGGVPTLNYQIQVSTDGIIYTTEPLIPGTTTQHSIIDPVLGTVYHFRLSAINSVGEGAFAAAFYAVPSALSLATIEYSLLVDWEGNGTFVDEWDRLVQIRKAVKGRDYSSQVLGKDIAGELEVILNNDDGRFSRDNPLSPLGASIRVQRPIGFRIHVETLTDTYDWYPWWGYIDEILPMPRRGGNNTVRLTGLGIMSLITNRPVSSPLRTAVETGVAAGVVLDLAQITAAQRGDVDGDKVMPFWWTNDERAIEALRAIEETEGGILKEQAVTDDSPKIYMEDSEFRLTGDRRNSFMTLSDQDEAGAEQIIDETLDQSTKDIVNIVRAPLRQFAAAGSEQVLWSAPTAIPLDAGDSLILRASYPTVNSPNGHVGVRSWTALAQTTDYQGNSAADGSGNDLTANLSVTVTDLATSLRVEVENTSATDDLFITRLQARGVPLVEGEALIIERDDQESIVDDNYGPLPHPLPAIWLGNLDDIVSYAQFQLAQLAQPRLRGTVAFEASDYLLAGNRPPDKSDRITVAFEGSRYEMFVEATNHVVGRGGAHLIELLVSPADVFGSIMVLDEGMLDVSILAR